MIKRSEKAAKEAERMGLNVNYVLNTKSTNHNGMIDTSKLNLSPNSRYIHYCDNETVHGVEFDSKFIDLLADKVPIN